MVPKTMDSGPNICQDTFLIYRQKSCGLYQRSSDIEERHPDSETIQRARTYAYFEIIIPNFNESRLEILSQQFFFFVLSRIPLDVIL
jgi:hypothetical protein